MVDTLTLHPSARARQRSRRGFTLLEALLASLIFVVVIGAIYTVYAGNQAMFTRGERMTDLQQNARGALDLLGREIRMAGYADTPGPPANSNPGRNPNPIIIDRSDLLVIRGNVTKAQPGGGVDVFYAVQPNQTAICVTPPCLLRGVYNPPGVGAYSLEGAGATWDVVAYNIRTVTFTYFDANNNQVDPGAPPNALDGANVGVAFPGLLATYTERGLVRRVVVTVTAADNRGALPYGGNAPVYILWTDINIRNLEGS